MTDLELNLFPSSPLNYEDMMYNLQSIDNTQILSKRINELSAIMHIANHAYKKLGKKFSQIELFEAGNCPQGELDKGTDNSNIEYCNIPYFFANHNNIVKYKGFDVAAPKEIISKDEYIRSAKSKKLAASKSQVNREYKKNQVNYAEFEDRILFAENPIIFSNYVFGCPELDKTEFWKLPGIHIHTMLVADLEREWLKKFHPEIYRIASNSNQGRIDITKEFSLEFTLRNKVPSNMQVSKLCTELFDTPKSKEYLITDNQAIIAYRT